MSHDKVDVADVGSKISDVRPRVPFVKMAKGGTYEIKDFDAKVSTWVKKVWVNIKRMRWNLVLIEWSGSCGSLFVGIVMVV